MKLATVIFAATVFLGNVVAQEYEKILVDIRDAFDKNTHRRLYDRYLSDFKKKPNKYTAFAYASLSWQWDLMREVGAVPSGGPDEGYAFKLAIKEEKKSGYPLAMYSWFMTRYRDRSLPPRPTKILKYIDIKDKNGKVLERNVPVYDNTAPDYASEKLQTDYIDRALRIDPTNPLALYLKYSFPLRTDPKNAKAASNVASLLDRINGTMYEIQVLSGLYFNRKAGNKGVPSNLELYLDRARETSGKGAYAKSFTFLKNHRSTS